METRFVLLLLMLVTDLILVAMALYLLFRRRLHWFDALAWLLLVILLPYLGPFLCILNRTRG